MSLDLLEIQEQLLREALESMRATPPDEIGSDRWVKQIKEVGAALSQAMESRAKHERTLRELGDQITEAEVRHLLASYLASMPRVQYDALLEEVEKCRQ